MTRARELADLSNASVFTIDNSYNVGLGTETPDAKLDVIGIVSATTYYGDGSNLDNVTSTTINNNADNRLITGSGTANTLNGESTCTYDGATFVTPAATVGSAVTSNSDGIDVTGVVTATSFKGDGSGLTGVASTDYIITSTAATFSNTTDSTSISTGAVQISGGVGIAKSVFIGGSLSIGGTVTYEDVTSVDSVGLVTAQSGIRIGTGGTVGPVASGIVTYYGDGSQLTGVVSGIELKQAGSSVGTSLTAINFASGATLTTGSAGISTITIAAPSISTTSSSPTANTVVTLDLDSAQHHQLTLSAGITTITCSGGNFGESHSVVCIQPSSGIATVGFSTYFLWPSASSPNMSEGSSKVDMLSFIVKEVGAVGTGTELLASAGLDYSY